LGGARDDGQPRRHGLDADQPGGAQCDRGAGRQRRRELPLLDPPRQPGHPPDDQPASLAGRGGPRRAAAARYPVPRLNRRRADADPEPPERRAPRASARAARPRLLHRLGALRRAGRMVGAHCPGAGLGRARHDQCRHAGDRRSAGALRPLQFRQLRWRREQYEQSQPQRAFGQPVSRAEIFRGNLRAETQSAPAELVADFQRDLARVAFALTGDPGQSAALVRDAFIAVLTGPADDEADPNTWARLLVALGRGYLAGADIAPLPDVASAEGLSIAERERLLLRGALLLLARPMRAALVLRDLGGLNAHDAALLTGIEPVEFEPLLDRS